MKLVTPPQAHEALEGNSAATYLDVRTEAEFSKGHPAGAINIPVFERGPGGMQANPNFLRVAEAVLDRNTPIYCGCQMGGRSKSAAELLIQAGFENVSNVVGGWGGGPGPDGAFVAGWKDADLPTRTDVAEDASYPALRRKAGL